MGLLHWKIRFFFLFSFYFLEQIIYNVSIDTLKVTASSPNKLLGSVFIHFQIKKQEGPSHKSVIQTVRGMDRCYLNCQAWEESLNNFLQKVLDFDDYDSTYSISMVFNFDSIRFRYYSKLLGSKIVFDSFCRSF